MVTVTCTVSIIAPLCIVLPPSSRALLGAVTCNGRYAIPRPFPHKREKLVLTHAGNINEATCSYNNNVQFSTMHMPQ